MCNGYKEAEKLADGLSWIAIEYIAIDHEPSKRFNSLAKHFFPKKY